MPINKKKYCPGGKCIKAAGEGEGECYSIELEKEKELDRIQLEKEKERNRILLDGEKQLIRNELANKKFWRLLHKTIYDGLEADLRWNHSEYMTVVYGSWDLHCWSTVVGPFWTGLFFFGPTCFFFIRPVLCSDVFLRRYRSPQSGPRAKTGQNVPVSLEIWVTT